MSTEKHIYEGILEILKKGLYRPEAINSKKTIPITDIRIIGKDGDYITQFFKDVPLEYNNKNVILEEYKKNKKDGGIFKDKLFLEGNFIPITSRVRHRENRSLV